MWIIANINNASVTLTLGVVPTPSQFTSPTYGQLTYVETPLQYLPVAKYNNISIRFSKLITSRLVIHRSIYIAPFILYF
jgi:hypothetical protein